MPTGSSTSAPAGTSACLRTPAATASGSADQPRREVSRSTIVAMRCSRSGSSADGRPWKRPTTSAVRSSAVGPSPPVVMSSGTPVPARKSSAADQVVRAVADDDDVPDVDAEAAQLLGQPRPVAVGHPAGEHLGARDDDPGPHAHGVDPRCPAGRPGTAGAPAGSVARPRLPCRYGRGPLPGPGRARGGPVSTSSDQQPPDGPRSPGQPSTQEIPVVPPAAGAAGDRRRPPAAARRRRAPDPPAHPRRCSPPDRSTSSRACRAPASCRRHPAGPAPVPAPPTRPAPRRRPRHPCPPCRGGAGLAAQPGAGPGPAAKRVVDEPARRPARPRRPRPGRAGGRAARGRAAAAASAPSPSGPR